jgi:hypothetical protein
MVILSTDLSRPMTEGVSGWTLKFNLMIMCMSDIFKFRILNFGASPASRSPRSG